MIERSGWKYYNHAMIPDAVPHEPANLKSLDSGQIWKENPRAFFARWTTEFDCGEETQWWYVIKDNPLDLMQLKAKRRYEIRKGLRNFRVEKILPIDWVDELLHITIAAFSGWPEKYRPTVNANKFRESVTTWTCYEVYGAFSMENGALCAYGMLKKCGKCAEFNVLRANPTYEPQGVNAAIVAGMLMDNESFLKDGGYICDGSRSINHETSFQDYLEKYFGFRKAYCKLHMAFRPGVGLVVKMLYPLQKLLTKLDHIGIIHQINAVITMMTFAEN